MGWAPSSQGRCCRLSSWGLDSLDGALNLEPLSKDFVRGDFFSFWDIEVSSSEFFRDGMTAGINELVHPAQSSFSYQWVVGCCLSSKDLFTRVVRSRIRGVGRGRWVKFQQWKGLVSCGHVGSSGIGIPMAKLPTEPARTTHRAWLQHCEEVLEPIRVGMGLNKLWENAVGATRAWGGWTVGLGCCLSIDEPISGVFPSHCWTFPSPLSPVEPFGV